MKLDQFDVRFRGPLQLESPLMRRLAGRDPGILILGNHTARPLAIIESTHPQLDLGAITARESLDGHRVLNFWFCAVPNPATRQALRQTMLDQLHPLCNLDSLTHPRGT